MGALLLQHPAEHSNAVSLGPYFLTFTPSTLGTTVGEIFLNASPYGTMKV